MVALVTHTQSDLPWKCVRLLIRHGKPAELGKLNGRRRSPTAPQKNPFSNPFVFPPLLPVLKQTPFFEQTAGATTHTRRTTELLSWTKNAREGCTRLRHKFMRKLINQNGSQSACPFVWKGANEGRFFLLTPTEVRMDHFRSSIPSPHRTRVLFFLFHCFLQCCFFNAAFVTS